MAERDAETVTDSIRNSTFRVTNMIRVCFINSGEGGLITIDDPSRRVDDITYFTFRATINPHFVDTRAPDSLFLFEFYLRLHRTFSSSSASLFVGNSIQSISSANRIYFNFR